MNGAIKSIIQNIFESGDKAYVIYSAMWPLSLATHLPTEQISNLLLQELVYQLKPNQTLLMPTFTHGFVDGCCNLDTEKSTTGILSESFRNLKETKRTCSAFFSFGVLGADADSLIKLRPEHAWGEGSLYEWMHYNDAQIVTFGTHPTHCSFTHRAEWLSKDIVSYRMEKSFSGKIIKDDVQSDLTETLYVRQYNPTPKNDWTWLETEFMQSGMKVYSCNGVKVTSMSAKKKMEIILPHIKKNPLCLLKNPNEFMEVK